MISASQFRAAVDKAGVKFGTREADKMLLHINFTSDGKVDYQRLEEHLDNLVSTLPATNPLDQKNEPDAWVVNLPGTGRKELPPDEEWRAKQQKMKEIVIANNRKIAEQFLKYEHDQISMEDFLNYCRTLGLKGKKRSSSLHCGYEIVLEILLHHCSSRSTIETPI
jgi:hypothetical protein